MHITIRFSDMPEDMIFEVANRKEYVNAVYVAWQYVKSDVGALDCFVECPDNLPQEWATVPGLKVPSCWGGSVELYQQWPKIVSCAERMQDLSEVIEDSQGIEGVVDSSITGSLISRREGVVIPFRKNIK